MVIDSKLIPVLREAVNVVKMAVFKDLKGYLTRKYPDSDSKHTAKLTGSIINELFGTVNEDETYATFVLDNVDQIRETLGNFAAEFDKLRAPVTDALRIQFLCDSQEGISNEQVLSKARELDILLVERNVPLPKTFMNMVRYLGVSYKILNPEALKIQ